MSTLGKDPEKQAGRLGPKGIGKRILLACRASFCPPSLVVGPSVYSHYSGNLFPNPLKDFELASESSDGNLFCNDPQGCTLAPEHVTKEKMTSPSRHKSNGNGT